MIKRKKGAKGKDHLLLGGLAAIEAMSNRRRNQKVGFSGLDRVSGMPAQVRYMTRVKLNKKGVMGIR